MLKVRRKSLIGTSKHSIFLVIVFFMAIFIGVGYSYLNSALSVNGMTKISKNTWNVHFDNILVKEGSIPDGHVTITNDESTIINFQVPLQKPGDFYEFSVDVVNSGTIDAKIGSIINTGLTEDQKKYLDYTVFYENGSQIKENDLLKSNKDSKIVIKVKYRDDITESNLPTEDQNINLTFNINYIQAD